MASAQAQIRSPRAKNNVPELAGLVDWEEDARNLALREKLKACLSYGAVSVSLTLFNRAAFSVYRFNYPATFTTIQIVLSIVYLYAFHWAGRLKLERFSLRTALKVFPLALFWWLYVVSGVTALRYLNVPMFSVLRRGTTILVVAGEWMAFRRVPNGAAIAALALTVGGAALASLGDPTYSAPGYFWVGVCVLSTAAYLILIRKLKESTGLDQHTLLLYNNVVALPLMVTVLILSGESRAVLDYPRLLEPKFLAFLLVATSQAFLLNLCIFWCTLVNSPLATNITGQVKDIALTSLGAMCFSDVHLTPLNILGLATGLAGSVAYSVVGLLAGRKGSSKS